MQALMAAGAADTAAYNAEIVKPSQFDEVAFFTALHRSGVRALLIGRRALVLLGLPVLTADYDFWLSVDDMSAFNGVAAAFDLHPSRTPDEARRHGRYVLENDEHVDVLVARAFPTVDGTTVEFEELWSRRRTLRVAGTDIIIPSIDDLILTKRVAARPKDLEDVVSGTAIERMLNRTVTADELEDALKGDIPAAERDEVQALVRWFTTRYPTGQERLAYVRQAYARWRASAPPDIRRGDHAERPTPN